MEYQFLPAIIVHDVYGEQFSIFVLALLILSKWKQLRDLAPVLMRGDYEYGTLSITCV